MNLAIFCERPVQVSRLRPQQVISTINWGNASDGIHTNILFYSCVLLTPPPMENQSLEFTKLQETLNEVWDSWKRSMHEENVSIIDRSLVPPVNNALIFRFVMRKSIGIKDLGAALNSIRKPNAPANVYAIGEGIYLVGFESMLDCNKVLARQPWQLSNNLMVFKKAIGNEKIASLVLNEVPFWVQIHGLEIQLLTRYVGELLGNKVGRVIEVDCSANSIAWGRCLRVRVLINVTKPLARGTKVNFDGYSSVVIFCYEKLSDFCYICGTLDHVERDCPISFTNNFNSSRELRQFEPWLRADGLKVVPVEELYRSAKCRGKQVVNEQEDPAGERVEIPGGDAAAFQIMQYGSNQNLFLGNETLLKHAMGNPMEVSQNPGGVESIMHAAGMGANQLWSSAGPFQNNANSAMGVNLGTYYEGQMDPVYNFNTNVEWVNSNTWPPYLLPYDAGASEGVGGTNYPCCESDGSMRMEAPVTILPISAPPIRKGKEPSRKAATKKSRK